MSVQLEGPEQLPGWGIAASSAGSAALAAWCTHPADVVKTRLQVFLLLCHQLDHCLACLLVCLLLTALCTYVADVICSCLQVLLLLRQSDWLYWG